MSAIETEKTPLECRTDEIGKWLGIVTLGVCLVVVGVSVTKEVMAGTFELDSTLPIILFAIALAVAAVPEALAAIVTGALAIAMHEMAKKNALVRKMPAVETLGCTSVICSDKTGTLTRAQMTVRRMYVGDRAIEVSGVGYAPEGQIDASLDDAALSLLLKGGILASDALLESDAGRWFVKGDPTEGALIVVAAKAGLRPDDLRVACPRTEEFPFSAERKRMTTIHTMDDRRRFAFSKGAPEVMVDRCASYMVGDKAVPMTDGQRTKLHEVNAQMASDALRVLGIAYKELPASGAADEATAEIGLTFLGLVGMMDPPREEAIEAVKVCRRIHIKPVMITGDHKLTAVAVAKEIWIYRDGDKVLTGDELAAMDEHGLAAVVEQVTVYARVSPLDKLKIVRAWKEKGHVVAMTGDGVNDAPALKQADIGVGMGIAGTEVAKEASDIILNDDNFATIVVAIERGRWIYDNIKKYLTYLLRANITEVVVLGGVVMVMGADYLPLLPAAILYINLATDGLPALALGIAPADPGIMQRPPRDSKESVFSFDVCVLIALGVVIECPLFLWMFFNNIEDLETARTQVFLMFVIIELILAMNFRSLRYSVLKVPPHKWLVIAIVWELALIVVLLQFDAVLESFGIAMPTWSDIGFVTLLGFGVFLTIEIAKWLLWGRKAPAPVPA